jgi:hypothetical protein
MRCVHHFAGRRRFDAGGSIFDKLMLEDSPGNWRFEVRPCNRFWVVMRDVSSIHVPLRISGGSAFDTVPLASAAMAPIAIRVFRNTWPSFAPCRSRPVLRRGRLPEAFDQLVDPFLVLVGAEAVLTIP